MLQAPLHDWSDSILSNTCRSLESERAERTDAEQAVIPKKTEAAIPVLNADVPAKLGAVRMLPLKVETTDVMKALQAAVERCQCWWWLEYDMKRRGIYMLLLCRK